MENEDLEGLPADLIPTTEYDDDVFEPEPTTPAADSDGASSSVGGKRRTQSLSSIQGGKEPQSPLKVSILLVLVVSCLCLTQLKS